MIYEAYSVLDKAVGAFNVPMFVRSRGEVMRMMTASVNAADHQFHKHAADYTLFFVGRFDDTSGVFEACEPVRVIGALELREDPFKPDRQVA